MSSNRGTRIAQRTLFALWVTGICAGFLALGAYQARPGDDGHAVGRWPAQTVIPLDRGRWNLLLFLHPQCPCSRASVSEFAALLDECGGRIRPRVILAEPARRPHEWEAGAIERAAAAIPGVTLWHDAGRLETRRFGVATSGHVLLFDHEGALAFAGGLTASRGHAGSNAGRDAVADLVHGRPPSARATAVFGCALHNRAAGNVEGVAR